MTEAFLLSICEVEMPMNLDMLGLFLILFHSHAYAQSSSFEVAGQWTRPTKQMIYAQGQFNPSLREILATAIHETGYQTPLNVTAIYDIATVFPDSTADSIAKKCRQESLDSWKRIACASDRVHTYLANGKYQELGRFNTFCFTHAEAFSKVFNRLKIPRANVGKVSANHTGPNGSFEHIANRITVTDITGITYSYILDVGWYPRSLFTNTELTNTFHDKNRDGKIDSNQLPTLPTEDERPKYYFGPAPTAPNEAPTIQ